MPTALLAEGIFLFFVRYYIIVLLPDQTSFNDNERHFYADCHPNSRHNFLILYYSVHFQLSFFVCKYVLLLNLSFWISVLTIIILIWFSEENIPMLWWYNDPVLKILYSFFKKKFFDNKWKAPFYTEHNLDIKYKVTFQNIYDKIMMVQVRT